MRLPILTVILSVSALVTPSLWAQQDSPPVDLADLLRSLRGLKEQQIVQVKERNRRALQEVQNAASSGTAAAAVWEDAVRQIQFDGISREGAQFREWKEGAALGEKEVQNAARLYFIWLGITLQRSAGGTNKELLPQVVQFTKDVTADQQIMELLEERLVTERAAAASGKHPNAKNKSKELENIKKTHDEIMNKALAASPPVLAQKIADFVDVENWEQTPGNTDGIFQKIILPQLRLDHDPRLLEYWDMKLKREGEAATKTKLTFEIDKFNRVRAPELVWKKAQDQLLLGQKNRALTEMFTLIKTHPTHPNAAEWIAKLEQLLVPAAAPTAASASAPAPNSAVPSGGR